VVIVGAGLGVSVGGTVGMRLGVGLISGVNVGLPDKLGEGTADPDGLTTATLVPVGLGLGRLVFGLLSRMKIVAPIRTISRNARSAAMTCAEREFMRACSAGE
jgi:hypothetical protein